ncbi:hypothetical protein ARC78_03040 [Stenotrophomonas pictorum JCM 9942]|jgi:hypothetical protein|uniref:Uncharacterized protein n=1 Tax=Stenotrophomonas pictorum JCM 9942 TaxID=1236960 RepID=A0A0R0AKV7_9GAMM|nr:hypothetical protein [Stenotrophomonas pictorum]KRG45177.1 hypothetical protein ARC78_03040 [Stenotrophomonas pictorum JCM 9942]
MIDLDDLIERAIDPSAVKLEGTLTNPPSFGVYAITNDEDGSTHYRFGNHPVRLHELEDKFGAAELEYLFLNREDAAAMTAALNRPEQ